MIDNTTARMSGTAEADAILLDARWGPGAIERMERDGQQQLVSSDRLPSEAAIAERLRIAAILNGCLPSGADALTPAILKALVAFWDTWWNKTATLESDLPGHSLITDEDATALSEAAEAVEELLFAPVDDAEDDQRIALAALDFSECDPAGALSHAVAALAGSSEGERLWMLDCGNLVQKHREHAAVASLRLGEIRAILLDGDHDDATARSLALAALARPEVTP